VGFFSTAGPAIVQPAGPSNIQPVGPFASKYQNTMHSQRRSSNLQVKLLDNAKKLLENVRKRDAENSLHLSSTMDSNSKYDIENMKPSSPDPFVASPRQVSRSPLNDYYNNDSPLSNDSLEESITSLEYYLIQERNVKLEEENEELTKEMSDIELKLSAIEFALGIVEHTSNDSTELSEGLSFSNRGKIESESMSSESNSNVRMDKVPESRNDDGSRTPPSVTESSLSSGTEQSEFMSQNNSVENKENRMKNENMKLTQDNESDEIKELREKNELMVGAIKSLAKATCAQARQRQHYKKKLLDTQKNMKAEFERMSEISKEKNGTEDSFLQTRTNFLQEQDKRETLSSELNRLVVALNFMKRKKEEDDDLRNEVLRTLKSQDDDIAQIDNSETKDEQLETLKAKLEVAIKYFQATTDEGYKAKRLFATPEEIEDAENHGFPITAVLSNADSEISIVLS
jgi:hypothetical protein